ncbi:MAG: phage integrase SAM-like domain-containing protein [Chitinophagaceae bacterium]|nr:phage integrase SAM-like domain-containing protein [Chitinophagaceae bacterium]
MKQATTTIFLDTRRLKKNNLYPVKLRVTFDRKRRYYPYPGKYDMLEKDFASVFSDNPKAQFKKIQTVLIAERAKADQIIDSLGSNFSFVMFERRFKEPSGNSKDIFALLETLAKRLRENDQISTAILTECSLNSLQKYHQKSSLGLEELDVSFWNKYEKWMIQEGNSNATIGMYIRRFRVVFNEAIAKRVIAKELYPFGPKNNDFKIPVGRNLKKALTLSDVGRIYNYVPKNPSEEKARDLWLFSYMGNGMNMKDIALLKFKNIDGEMIRFERAKTERSNKDKPVEISFALSPDIARIIKKWGNKSIYEGNYLFPILTKQDTVKDQYYRVYNAVKFTNKHMKAICRDLGITAKVTTYVARHSFATILRNSGKPIELIGNEMGHSSIKVTQGYFGRYEDPVKKEVAEVLTNFQKTGSES